MAVTKFRGSMIALAATEDGLKSGHFLDGEIATAKLADGANFIKKDGTVAMTGALAMGAQKITSLDAGTVGTDAVNYTQLQTKALLAGSTGQTFSVADAVALTDATSLQQVNTLLANAGAASEWQNSCGSYAITPPGSPTTGDRVFVIQSYVADTGVVTLGTPTGAFTGKAGHIAQWTGSAWTFTVATSGTYVSVDTETTGFFFYSGTWAFKSFEATTVGTGTAKTIDNISANIVSNGQLTISASQVFKLGTLEVALNGIGLTEGATNDYTVTDNGSNGTGLIMNAAMPLCIGDHLLLKYELP